MKKEGEKRRRTCAKRAEAVQKRCNTMKKGVEGAESYCGELYFKTFENCERSIGGVTSRNTSRDSVKKPSPFRMQSARQSVEKEGYRLPQSKVVFTKKTEADIKKALEVLKQIQAARS